MSKDKRLSDYASEVFEEVKSSVSPNLADGLEVDESSAGDKPMENFVQTYLLDGHELPVYLIEFIDGGIKDNPRWFAINDFNVDNPDKWNAYERAYMRWKAMSGYKDSVLMDETGAVFRDMERAMDFERWAEKEMDNEARKLKGIAGKGVNALISAMSQGIQVIRESLDVVGGSLETDFYLDINDGEEWDRRHVVMLYEGDDVTDVFMRTDKDEEFKVEYDQVIYILEELSDY